MAKLTLKDLDLSKARVLMRVDFNVPMENGKITDDSRIKAALPSIQYILSKNASLILMSHLGRPKKIDPSLSLNPCAKRLSEILKIPVEIAPDCIGKQTEKMASDLLPGQILLLENLRFHPEEEKPTDSFVKQLAALGTCYVNDAFGTAHRAHASTAAIAKFFPRKSAMGFLMEKEIKELSPLLENPKRPFYALIGGAKISTKIGVIKKLLDKVDGLFIGGGMAYTFLKEEGIEIGDSISEDPETVRDIPKTKLYFPLDFVIADTHFNIKIIGAKEGIPAGWQGMDIGPKTVSAWSKILKTAGTIFWNGPVGVFEKSEFAKGTKEIAETLAQSRAKTIVGGGDSLAAIQQMGLANRFAHLSTGGGAALEYLEFGHLPGIDALSNK